jgi:hypothetical protein
VNGQPAAGIHVTRPTDTRQQRAMRRAATIHARRKLGILLLFIGSVLVGIVQDLCDMLLSLLVARLTRSHRVETTRVPISVLLVSSQLPARAAQGPLLDTNCRGTLRLFKTVRATFVCLWLEVPWRPQWPADLHGMKLGEGRTFCCNGYYKEQASSGSRRWASISLFERKGCYGWRLTEKLCGSSEDNRRPPSLCPKGLVPYDGTRWPKRSACGMKV